MSDKLHREPEQVSLLVDGQLQGDDFARAMDQLAASDDARRAWDHYHLIGEVMRSGDVSVRGHDPAFVERLRRQLALDAALVITNSSVAGGEVGQKPSWHPPANDPWWRRVAGLASITVVGVLAWQGYAWMDGRSPTAAVSQLTRVSGGGVLSVTPAVAAIASAPTTVDQAAAAMLRDPRLDALLAAHRQFGGTSVLQMPSGFLRNATFEEGKR
jgi:sigma-E factor negative regulatory protein RseA